MADDIGTRGQDPRQVAEDRRREGEMRRARARAAKGGRKNLPVPTSGGSRGGGGGGGGGRALSPAGGDRSSIQRGGPGTALTRDGRIPLNLGPAGRAISGRALGPLSGMSATMAADATLTGTEEGRRILEDHEARRNLAAQIRSDEASRGAEADSATQALSEAEEVQRSRRNERQRAANRPMTRMSARQQTRPSEMSADDLNAMSLARGVGPDNAPDTEAAANIRRRLAEMAQGLKKGGAVKKMAKGGAVKKMATGGVAASKRADGCAMRGKTKGRMV